VERAESVFLCYIERSKVEYWLGRHSDRHFVKGKVVVRRILLIVCVLALLLASFAPAAAQYGQTIHIVQRGETLASIARWYGTTVQAIASANSIWNPNWIYAGQRLVIPTGTSNPPPGQQNYYIVRPGDTLAGVARYFGTSIWAIAQANNILNLNRIYAGMYLVIPAGGYPPPPTQNFTTYTVRPGDTLARIAASYGTTVQAITSLNGLWNPNYIFWGQVLKIPVYSW
jgi:LysM repeat protein